MDVLSCGFALRQCWSFYVRELKLDNNAFTASDWTVVTSLQFLSLFRAHGNTLRGTIPSSLSQLSLLAGFDLSKNALSGTVPATLSLLTRLR